MPFFGYIFEGRHEYPAAVTQVDLLHQDAGLTLSRYNLRVRKILSAEIPTPPVWPGLKARIAVLIIIFSVEKVFLDQFIDSQRAQAALGLGAIVHSAQHWGFRFLVAFVAATVVFTYVRGCVPLLLMDKSVRAVKLHLRWMLIHVFVVANLAALCHLLYRGTTIGVPFAALVTILVAFSASAALAAMLALAPGSLWLAVVRSLGAIWAYAAIAAVLGTGIWQWTERLWEPASALTFELVKRVLWPVLPTLTADAVSHVLRTDRFAVEVTETCSGLEGMGLILAFTAAWLVYFRREYIFPRALLLAPVGLAAMFALNVLRIAVLMLIGHAGFPDVAASGFHSQAGWIAFNSVACALVYFSRRSTWLNRAASNFDAPTATHNPTATHLMPLLAILAAGALSRAMSDGFESFYALRLVAGVSILTLYRRRLMALDWRWSWRGPFLGMMIFIFWIICAHFLLPAAALPGKLAAMPPAWRGIWVTSRVAAAVFIIPVAEELAYRGFLMRRLSSPDFESVPFRSVGWLPLTATAIVFGFAHGALWFPGIVAGMAFGLIVLRRGHLGEAVAAHCTTNALVAVSVLAAGDWQLW